MDRIDEVDNPFLIERSHKRQARLKCRVVKYNTRTNHKTRRKVFTDVNPFYCKRRLKDLNDKNHEVNWFAPKKTPPSHIRILIPNKDSSAIHESLSRNIFTYYGWFTHLTELSNQIYFFTNTNNHHMLPRMKPSYYDNYIYNLNRIYLNNQRHRWQMKRLLNIWLMKRCLKRVIGADSDIFTLGPIHAKDKIHITCMRTRSVYVFSGNALLRTACSSLETQAQSIPDTKAPCNPFTNIVFNYGQMLEVYNGCLQFCVTRRKSVPLILSMYRDSNFSIQHLLKSHSLHIQYLATQNYMKHDDHDNYILYENLGNIFKLYKDLLGEFAPICSALRFKVWIEMDPHNFLHTQWRSFLTDYWHYEQTEHLCRANWISETSIVFDMLTLLEASEQALIQSVREFRRRNSPRRIVITV